jgi:GTP cyclohydrolase II
MYLRAQVGGLLRFLLPGGRGIGLCAKLDAYGLEDARPRHV